MRTDDNDGKSRRGRARKNFGKDTSGEWIGFVDITLSEDERERVKCDLEGGLLPSPGILQEMVDGGYKVTFVRDGRGGGCIATATGKGDDNPNRGYSLAGRGPDVAGALAMLEHKVVAVCQWGSWLESDVAQNRQLSLWG